MTQVSSNFKLQDYRNAVQLDQPYEKNFSPLSGEEKEAVVDCLVHWFYKEAEGIGANICSNEDYAEKRCLLRALLNVRAPKLVDPNILQLLNQLLQTETDETGIVSVSMLKSVAASIASAEGNNNDKFILWQGDITHLEVDAIVNAANNQLLGCFQPLHACIDNAIHSAAGPQLRQDCHAIMNLQGAREKTGDAKITRAYNLPSKYVLHTVGPIVPRQALLNERHKAELASSYVSCLELAKQIGTIKSIAFCAISTGVFGFPKREAGEVAVSTVNKWLNHNPNTFEQIVFCVFSQEDYLEYVRAFQTILGVL